MNVYEARNHMTREILVAATPDAVAKFVASLRKPPRAKWGRGDRVELVVLGENLDDDSARAFVRAYCPLRATPGWRVAKLLPAAPRPAVRKA